MSHRQTYLDFLSSELKELILSKMHCSIDTLTHINQLIKSGDYNANNIMPKEVVISELAKIQSDREYFRTLLSKFESFCLLQFKKKNGTVLRRDSSVPQSLRRDEDSERIDLILIKMVYKEDKKTTDIWLEVPIQKEITINNINIKTMTTAEIGNVNNPGGWSDARPTVFNIKATDETSIKIRTHVETMLPDINELVSFCEKLISNGKTGGGDKIRILGRLRKITIFDNKKHVTYKGEKIPLSDAKKIEKSLTKKQRTRK